MFEGGVEIEFLLPEDPALAPPGEQIAEVTLLRSAPGEPVTRTVRRRGGNGELDMGTIEAGEGLQLAVELRSSTQRLLGFGRAAEPIDLSPGGSVTVAMHVRRPFVYVTGDTNVTTFDPTVDVLDARYRGSITGFTGAAVAATTPDGATLILGVSESNGGVLHFVSTSKYSETMLDPIGLRQAPADLVVSPSGRYAVVAHEGATGGVSVIDLHAPTEPSKFVSLGSVERVVVAPVAPGSAEEQAYALINQDFDCQSTTGSRVTRVDLGDPRDDGPSTPFAAPIQDIAASAEQPFAVVANACENKVERVEPGDDVARVELAQVPNVSAVAVVGDRVWSVGSAPTQDGTGQQLHLVSMDLSDNPDTVTDLELPLLQERATTATFSGPGELAIRQIAADTIYAARLAVLPGAESIALLTRGEFYAEEIYENVFGTDVLVMPRIRITNREYLLIDTATNTLVQRLRTSCELELLSLIDALVDDWVCSTDEDLVEPGFTPTGLSVLYGAR